MYQLREVQCDAMGSPAECPLGQVVPTPLLLRSRTVATVPAGRSRTTIGVGERVNLTSSGGTGAHTWTITGSSTLNRTTGNTVRLTADDRAETTTVTVTDAAGAAESLTFTVIEPSSVRMVRAPGTGVWHVHAVPSVGMKLNIYIRPATVSFENIEIEEDDCVAAASGYLAPLNGIHHAGHGAGNWVSVGSVTAGQGSKVDGQDTAQGPANYGLPYSAGSFDWPIPWRFRVGTGASKRFATVHQHFTTDAAGTMTVTKGGASASAAVGDATATY